MLEGGHDYDGRPIVPFDEAGMRRAARQIRDKRHPLGRGRRDLLAARPLAARSGRGRSSPRNARRQRSPCRTIWAASASSSARTRPSSTPRSSIWRGSRSPGFTRAIAASGIAAPLYLTQNDGTVMSAEVATALPVMSFASGATNSMRGAAFLSGLADAMVIDVGGTSTDVGQLRRGFPREANSVVEIGGVRTLFRMPDLLSIGLGGGSVVERDPLAVGPKSVGYRLTREALVFGGKTLTATDVAVAAGLAEIGDTRARRGLASRSRRGGARRGAGEDRGCGRPDEDRSRRSAVDRGRRRRLSGARPARRHLGGDPGARMATAPMRSARRSRRSAARPTRSTATFPRSEAIALAEAQAKERAVAAGADRASLETVDVEDMPLAYLPGNALRVRVRVAGEMAAPAAAQPEASPATL